MERTATLQVDRILAKKVNPQVSEYAASLLLPLLPMPIMTIATTRIGSTSSKVHTPALGADHIFY